MPHERLTFLICIGCTLLLVSACSQSNNQTVPTPESVTMPTTSGPATPTITLSPITPATSTERPSPSPTFTPPPTPTPDFSALSAQLPASIYYFAHNYDCEDLQSVWRITPGASEAERVIPEGIQVAAFDIWPGDGRMAYGTTTGELYVVMPGREPQRVLQADAPVQHVTRINCVRWSPSGTRLAYCVRNEGGSSDPESMTRKSGLWILTLEDNSRVHLLQNRYQSDDVGLWRVLRDVAWSPDEQAMILKTANWEWYDIYWLYPLEYSPDEANLHDPEGLGWYYGNWTSDSQHVLVTGRCCDDPNNVVQIDRQSMEHNVLVDAEKLRAHALHAQGLAGKIIFSMYSYIQGPEAIPARFYLGQQNDTGFSYTPVGPQEAPRGDPGYITWDSTERWAVMSAAPQVISLDEDTPIDLSPMLMPARSCEQGGAKVEAFWGPPKK